MIFVFPESITFLQFCFPYQSVCHAYSPCFLFRVFQLKNFVKLEFLRLQVWVQLVSEKASGIKQLPNHKCEFTPCGHSADKSNQKQNIFILFFYVIFYILYYTTASFVIVRKSISETAAVLKCIIKKYTLFEHVT